jgi:hypothetical protein
MPERQRAAQGQPRLLEIAAGLFIHPRAWRCRRVTECWERVPVHGNNWRPPTAACLRCSAPVLTHSVSLQPPRRSAHRSLSGNRPDAHKPAAPVARFLIR